MCDWNISGEDVVTIIFVGLPIGVAFLCLGAFGVCSTIRVCRDTLEDT